MSMKRLRERWHCLAGLAFCAVATVALWGPGARAGVDTPADVPGNANPATPAKPSVRTLHIAKVNPPVNASVSDEAVGKAIEKGADWLMAQMVNGAWKDMTLRPAFNDNDARKVSAGADFLGVYALLSAGTAIDNPKLQIKKDPFLRQCVAAMKDMEIVGEQQTYSRGIRLTALAMLQRPDDRPLITSDVLYLLDCCHHGGWTYDMRSRKPGNWRQKEYLKDKSGDNSNSQYGLLGLWSAESCGAEIPADVWKVVEEHWTEGESANGQWGYVNGQGEEHLSMTLAGVASLLVCHDVLEHAKFSDPVAREPYTPNLTKGLAWLETGDNAIMKTSSGYDAYGIERVGLASGFKYFGTHDWYSEIATRIVSEQKDDGHWEYTYSSFVDTAFSVLFLSKGRHAVIANKLRFEKYWNNRPHDLGALAKFIGGELEQTFNWQVASLNHDWPDWLDAPILYIASDQAPALSDADYAKIRGYIEAGGLLYTQQDGRSGAFNQFVEKTMLPKLFPDYEMAKVPETSDLYNVYEAVKVKPPLKMVTNGARILWVHSSEDLAASWEKREAKSKPDLFRLGMNMFVYAAGKSNFRKRIESTIIPVPPVASADNTVRVARVKYPLSSWDPEPYAWTRFSHWMGWQTSVGVSTQTVDIGDLGKTSPAEVPMAHLTGSSPFTPTDAQLQSLRAYVDNGGTLFIDSCGGVGFNDSIDKILAKAFAGITPAKLAATHPLLNAGLDGMSDLGKLELRPFAAKTMGKTDTVLFGFKCGKGHVIYTTLDVTNGLLGSRTWGVVGLETASAQQLLKNLILWSARGSPDN